MPKMQLIEVKDRGSEREWTLFPVQLYKNDPNYIRPIDKEINDLFDRSWNRLFKVEKSDAIRWVLKRNGKTIGRIAAFVNGNIYDKEDQPTGGCGFFDCIDDQEAADLLFDSARKWLTDRGMEAMDGPINFGERDKNWGVLIDGFAEQNYGMPYNAPYYQRLFEHYGFQLYFNQYTYGRMVSSEVDFTPRFYERAKEAQSDPGYTFRALKRSEYDKAAGLFLEVYNKAWGGHSGVKKMTLDQAKKMFAKLKPIADMRLMYFGFYHDRPVSFFLSMPELNQLYKHVNGNMNWWGKLKFFYHLKTGSSKKMLGLVFGVVPEHHGKGVESAMVIEVSKVAWSGGLKPYNSIEMNWVGDFNPKMMRVCEQLSATIWRTHATYRYLFDRNKEFKRCPIID